LVFLGDHFRDIKQRVAGLATYTFDNLPHSRQVLGEALFVNHPGVGIIQLVVVGQRPRYDLGVTLGPALGVLA